MVKRMRFFGQDQDLHLVTMSNCHMLSVAWSEIVAAMPADLPPAAVVNATNMTLAEAATNTGAFTKILGDPSTQFSSAAHCVQQ